MNSKKLGLLVILLALFAILFVSCNSEVTDAARATNVGNELVYATFDNNSKGIVVNTIAGYKSYDELYWFYTATKTDSFGTTGQTSALVPVRVVDNDPAPGLSGKVGPFSQGSWSFTLYAYDDADRTNLYYQGSTSPDVTLRNGVDNYIPVTVTPQGDYGYIAFYNGTNTTDTYFEWKDNKGGNGALRLDITLKDSNNVVYNCVSKSLTKGTDGKYKIDGRILKTATDDKFAVGVYTATFQVVNPSDSSVVFTSQDLSLRVYGNLETQLKGSLTEIVEAYGYFQVPEQQINVFIATAAEVTQTVNVAPEKYSSTQTQQTTTVKFEAAALDTTNSQHTLKVEVTPIATAATKFDVIGDETAVAGIDFELKKIVTTTVGDVTTTTEETVEKFENQKYATIETYIAKGFNTVTVVYTGTELAQPIANELDPATNVATVYNNDSDMGTHLGYSKASGLLRFKTNHFSEYYVKASVEAINVTTNTVYTTLADAVAAVKDDETIQLIKNVTISDKLVVGSDTEAKNFVLDLNGKTLTGRTNLVRGNLTFKNGNLICVGGQPLNVYGSSSSTAKNYSVLTVESDVAITGDYAVCLFGKTATTNGYGAVVNYYGSATTTKGALFVSGNLGKDEGLADQNNIINIYGSVTSSDAAVALNGNALINIYDGAELTGNTAVTVKRGKLVIVGGTITSNGEKDYPPAANNSGTEMTGAGVSVTNTYNNYGPLAVEISGGLITSAKADAVYRAAQTYANDATVSITGGTFSSDPSQVHVTDEKVDDYVAAGYKSNKIDEKLWTVVKKDRTDDSVAAVVKADDSVLYFSTLADAVDAAEDGETIMLLKDATVGSQAIYFNGGKTVILDLAGHTLLSGNGFVIYGANLTVKNGTINGNEGQVFNVFGRNTDGDASYSVLTINSDAEIINAGFGVCVFPFSGTVGYDTEINLNGSITGVCGIFVSGNLANENSDASNAIIASNVININSGSSISTTDQAIAMNGGATVNVKEGSSLTGSEAIGLKRGTLNISGGTLRATGEYAEPTANNNGTEASGAVVSITSTYNYAHGIVAIISGGTFESANGHALAIQKTGTTSFDADALEVTVTGGTFTAGSNENAKAVYADYGTATKFVVGGRYSTKPASSYIADGSYARVIDNYYSLIYEKWSDYADSSWYSSTSNTFDIDTPAKLAGLIILNRTNSFAGKTINITEDIDLTGKIWTPIECSNLEYMFRGTVNGNNHKITGLFVANDNGYGNGFFGHFNGVIKDITFEDALVQRRHGDSNSGNIYGIVAGYAGYYGEATFINVTVKNSTVKGFGKVGAIAAHSEYTDGIVNFDNCKVVNTIVDGVYDCGGLIALGQGTVNISNCDVSGAIWHHPSSEQYEIFENTHLIVDGIERVLTGYYWIYYDYLYAGWGDYYCDYNVGTISESEYSVIVGFVHNIPSN
jgi:hypothetical protein